MSWRVSPLVLVLPALLAATPAARAEVTVAIDPGPGGDWAARAGLDLATVEGMLKSELDKLFQTARLKDYLRAFGDAQAFTTRGLGVDYASHMRFLMVGFAANVSINAEKAFVPTGIRTQPPVGGFATTFSFMAGHNLGWLGLRPLTIFGNYFKSSGSYREFSAGLQNWGVHAQLRLFGPERDDSLGSLILRWGGIDITTGIDYARMDLRLAKAFARAIPISERPRASVNLDSMGAFDMDLRTFNIPLEVTTNFRFLYVLSVYGGAGFDWQLGGGSDMKVDLSGSMTGLLENEMPQPIGTAQIVATETADPSVGRLRGILGLQASLWFVRAFAQLNFVPSDPFLASFAFGTRLVW